MESLSGRPPLAAAVVIPQPRAILHARGMPRLHGLGAHPWLRECSTIEINGIANRQWIRQAWRPIGKLYPRLFSTPKLCSA